MGKNALYLTADSHGEIWELKQRSMRAMSTLPHFEEIVSDAAQSLGMEYLDIWPIFNPHLRNRSRDFVLSRHTEVLETLSEKREDPWEPSTDPLLLLWRIRNEIQSRTLAPFDIQCPIPSTGSPTFRAMAFRTCFYWSGHPAEHRLHRSIHDEILHGRPARNRSLVLQARTWRNWFRTSCHWACEEEHPARRIVLHDFLRKKIRDGQMESRQIYRLLSEGWRELPEFRQSNSDRSGSHPDGKASEHGRGKQGFSPEI